MGDSITIGFGGIGGYRLPLWLEFLPYGPQRPDLVGGRTLGSPPVLPDQEHEAHSGWRLRDFVAFAGDDDEPPSTIESLLAASEPDVVLLHAGTNDLWDLAAWQEAPLALAELLDRAHAARPETHVVVAQLLPTVEERANLAVEWLAPRFARVVHERWMRGQRVQLVDMRRACPVLTTNDGVHPDMPCYGRMACQWAGALADLDAYVPLAPPAPPAVPVARAEVDGIDSLTPPVLAHDGSGLQDSLHAPERSAPLGWRTAPAWMRPEADGRTAALETPVSLTLWLEGRADLARIELWNGRVEPRDGSWVPRESVAEIALETTADGREWVDRGLWRPLAAAPRAMAPPEGLEVDWRGVVGVRLRVERAHVRLTDDQPRIRRCLSLSEIRLSGPGTPSADGSRVPVRPRR